MKNPKTILIVTGASKGLGRAIVEAAARRADLTILPVSRQTRPRWWRGADWITADVSTERGASKAMEDVSKKVTARDSIVLFNNAGDYVSKPITDIDDAILESSFRANFLTVFNSTKAFCARFDQGRVAIIVGASAFSMNSKTAAYATIKIATVRLMQTFRSEYAGKGLKFCVISAGSINTWSEQPVDGASDAKEVADFLLTTFATRSFYCQEIRLEPT